MWGLGFFASDFNRNYLKREEINMLKTLFHPLTLHTFPSRKIGFYTSVQVLVDSICEFQLQLFTLNQFFHYCWGQKVTFDLNTRCVPEATEQNHCQQEVSSASKGAHLWATARCSACFPVQSVYWASSVASLMSCQLPTTEIVGDERHYKSANNYCLCNVGSLCHGE